MHIMRIDERRLLDESEGCRSTVEFSPLTAGRNWQISADTEQTLAEVAAIYLLNHLPLTDS
jgi:hypothetical protein